MALAVDGYRLGFVLSTGVATVLVLIDGATRDGQYACRTARSPAPHLNGGWVLALALDWLSSRANNVKGGRRNTSTRTVEPGAPAGG